MESNNTTIKNIGTAPKLIRPILGIPQHVDRGSYVVKNRAFIGVIYRIVCPKCGHTLLVRANSIKPHKAICKECNTPIYYMGKEHQVAHKGVRPTAKESQMKDESKNETIKIARKNIQVEEGESGSGTVRFGKPNARLEWGGFFNKHFYNIQRVGEHYIGRKDDEIKSDAAINDEYVSRRSLLLEALPKSPHECVYKLTVKKAANPVLVNGKAYEVGESIFLNFGDTILVGNTTLTFKQGIKK